MATEPSPLGPSRTVLVVLSDVDPVARGVAGQWETAEGTGDHVDGVPLRQLDRDLFLLRRPGPHLHDELLDRRLPGKLLARGLTLLFPSIHRSGSGQHCFTVHPLGNPGGKAEYGGRPRTLVPTDPRAMAALLRELDATAGTVGTIATFEATHHGPELGLPALFAEVQVAGESGPTEAEIGVLARAIRVFRPDPRDRVALAVGGGHYAPRFTDLARSRRWAFGHILSRHALDGLEPTTAREAFAATPGAEGVVYARPGDREHPALRELGPELREGDAPVRTDRAGAATSRSLPTSGT